MPNRRLQLIGALPIPVGHRVEVVWYRSETTTTGLFGGDKTDTKELPTPRVIDLDTGIRYGVLAHYTDQPGYRAGTINVHDHELRGDLRVSDQITGEVVSCSIVDLRFEGRGSDQLETELVVDVDG